MKKKEKEKELKCGSLPTADIVGAIGKIEMFQGQKEMWLTVLRLTGSLENNPALVKGVPKISDTNEVTYRNIFVS